MYIRIWQYSELNIPNACKVRTRTRAEIVKAFSRWMCIDNWCRTAMQAVVSVSLPSDIRKIGNCGPFFRGCWYTTYRNVLRSVCLPYCIVIQTVCVCCENGSLTQIWSFMSFWTSWQHSLHWRVLARARVVRNRNLSTTSGLISAG